MQNFLSLGYMLRVLLAVSANFPDNPRMCRHIYDWNIVNCDAKHPIYLTCYYKGLKSGPLKQTSYLTIL